jgi:phospholipid/cholesterol/gamma-HCH transport system ATP-binding protein
VFGADQDNSTVQELQTLERRWGVLYQEGALFSSLTVFQNIEFPMREYLIMSNRLMREIATVKLEMVGLKPEDGVKHPAELSGGMTKRIALARALALDPAIVFLDEPTSGLDPIAAREFGVLIHTLQRTLGLTVFMVTHDIDALRTICDRIAVLDEGKIIAIGSMSQVLAVDHPYLRSFFRGVRNSPSSAPANP